MAIRLPGRHFARARSAINAGIAEPESDLQSRIVSALKSISCDVTVTSQPQRSMVTPGTPDLYVRHAAWKVRVWMETKTDDGVVSKVQREWHAKEREAGGRVEVVRSIEDAMDAVVRARGEREAVAPKADPA